MRGVPLVLIPFDPPKRGSHGSRIKQKNIHVCLNVISQEPPTKLSIEARMESAGCQAKAALGVSQLMSEAVQNLA